MASYGFTAGQKGNVVVAAQSGYPTILWYNGKPALKKLGGVQAYGGFVVKQKVAERFDQPWPLGELIEFTYANGTSDMIYDIGPAKVAILASRVDWFFGAKEDPEWVGKRYTVRDGVKPKARNRYLLLLKGAEHVQTQPLMLTMFGVAGLMFHKAYQEFLKTVHAAGEQVAGGKLDAYTFFMNLVPGPTEKASRNFDSTITPPKLELSWPTSASSKMFFDADNPGPFLELCYIGEENMALCASWWKEASAWAAAEKDESDTSRNSSSKSNKPSDDAGGEEEEIDLTSN